MSYRLVNDPDGVSVLAAQVSERTGLPRAHVEKDFWVTEVIRGVVAAAHPLGTTLVFKGGTSLSKAKSAVHVSTIEPKVVKILV